MYSSTDLGRRRSYWTSPAPRPWLFCKRWRTLVFWRSHPMAALAGRRAGFEQPRGIVDSDSGLSACT